ncbi:MAG TPA: ornithine aminomutase [Acholeplasmatales bacterium]|nr:MAG: ornithine aminomutase [Tenericutes bacterium GWF2_57_13]HAQ56277.1 ornithine aminomutase [Acholeplasmatales bacterium]
MNKTTVRPDDFTSRREHLAQLTDAQLKAYFWELADRSVDPLIALAKTHTTPSIERSVLLRMGFSDVEAKLIVDKTIDRRLIGKGAGHVVYRLATIDSVDVRTAGLKLLADEGWDRVAASFGGKR